MQKKTNIKLQTAELGTHHYIKQPDRITQEQQPGKPCAIVQAKTAFSAEKAEVGQNLEKQQGNIVNFLKPQDECKILKITD